MKANDIKAGKAHAKALHEQIETLKRGGKPSPSSPATPESPASFVHRRMSELAREKRATTTGKKRVKG